MNIIILHDPLSEASRVLLFEMGGEPAGEDVTITLGGREVRVISKHALAVAACPNFSAYPAIVVQDGEAMRVKSPVESWADCLDFADNPPVAVPAQASRTMTKYEFRTKVLTFEERLTMDNSTIPELVTMRNDLSTAEVVDLDEVAKYRPVMLATGLATEARINQIIAGVIHE
ncbi:MAG: hypothetical protein FD177_206 [Desulfovibrionaceae bacterium]|nr:MAG: hypothetical protein FD177_206 [Desulfovibrionaceae bacterium]